MLLEQAQQTLASICMVLSGSLALVLLYVAIVTHCEESQWKSGYCFRLLSTSVLPLSTPFCLKQTLGVMLVEKLN
jgi:hypothetical protein